jgi:catechol 2,3-dioxygenase-like lactoylglutathione lyase family enzyme
MNRFVTAAFALWVAAIAPTWAQSASAADDAVTGIQFIGRSVSDLDRAVAFYKAIGFTQDMQANPAWRKDEVTQHLYSLKGGAETRMAKMAINSNQSGKTFNVYLREFRGIARKNVSDHTAWEPGSTHFGLVVPDAQALWSQLKANGLLKPRSWGGELIAPPGQTKGMLAYLTDPDGLDIEIIDQRPTRPPGVSHVGLIVLDSTKARAFYETLMGGKLVNAESPWLKGDFYDSAIGGHGNVLRFFNESFAETQAPESRLNVELVEFENRKKPVEPYSAHDIGVGYVGFEVKGLDAFLARVKAAGAKVVSDGIVTMRSGTRVVMVRDPDVGGFVELFEQPKK